MELDELREISSRWVRHRPSTPQLARAAHDDLVELIDAVGDLLAKQRAATARLQRVEADLGEARSQADHLRGQLLRHNIQPER